MVRLAALLFLLLWVPSSVMAVPILAAPNAGAGGGGGGGVTTTTIGALDTCNAGADGTLATITDGTDSTDCTVAGGSFVNSCICDGGSSTWLDDGDGAGGGLPGDPAACASGPPQQFVTDQNASGVLACDFVVDADIPDTITIDLAAAATALAADPADCGANEFADAIAASGALTCNAIVDADVPDTITVDLAATATALAADPADCGANEFADAIVASGALTCNAIVDADVPDTITVSAYLPLAGGMLTGEFTVDDLGVAFNEGDALSDCSTFPATGGGIFFDDSEGIFKKCQDNVLTDLDTGGSGLWTDGGSITYLTATGDDVSMGGSTSGAPFHYDVGTGAMSLNVAGASIDIQADDDDGQELILKEGANDGSNTWSLSVPAGGLAGVTDWEMDTNGLFDASEWLTPNTVDAAEIDETAAYDYGGSSGLELPNAAAPTTNAAGELALDTTITDHQPLWQYYDGGENMTVIAIDTAQLPALDNEVVAYDAASDKFVLEAGGGGSGDVTDVFDCASGNCDDIIVESGDTLGVAPGGEVHATETHLHVNNDSGSTLFACTAVYVSGFDIPSNLPEVDIADADNAGAMPAIGIVESDIANGADGGIILLGTHETLDTNTSEGWSVGDALYVNDSGTSADDDCGNTLTNVRPANTDDNIQKIGSVGRVHATQGEVVVSGANRSNDVPNLEDAKLWVGNGSNVATAVAMSVDATMANTGAVTVAATHSGSAHHAATVDTNSVKEFNFSASGLQAIAGASGDDAVAPLGKDTGTNSEIFYRAFDDTDDECVGGTFTVPSDLTATGGDNVTFRVVGYAATAAADPNDIVALDFKHRPLADSESWDGTFTTESDGGCNLDTTQDDVTNCTWTETVTNTGWVAFDMVEFELCRDGDEAGVADLLVGDFHLIHFTIEVPRE